jgi:DNA replication and repair protein RecF
MRLTHLSLTNFRAFSRLDVDFPSGIVLLHGSNAQGKTSLLEAIYYLATFTSFLTAQDAQTIHFLAREEPIPVGRIVADIEKHDRAHQMEIRLILQENQDGQKRLRKEILIDGVKKSAGEAIGLFTSVVFIPQMTRLFENGPEERRRYMNLAFCQVIPGYTTALTKYNQALTRRNALLKDLGERGGDEAQLDYWDDLLVTHGKRIMANRQSAISELNVFTKPIHTRLTGGQEAFQLIYQSSLPGGVLPADSIQELEIGAAAAFHKRLVATRRHDIQRGVTTSGPHRDDLQFLVNGLNQADYGSRGQIRTVLQSLKLGEVGWMKEKTQTAPVLLMDETLAELDENRRRDLLDALGTVDQAVLTTTDEELFVPEFLQSITRWEIEGGRIIGSVS